MGLTDDASGAAWAPGGRRGQMSMPMPAEWSFGATIPAKDLERTRRFYEDILGSQAVM